MKNKGLKIVLIILGLNLLYYCIYGIYLHYELSQIEGIGMSMLYLAVVLWNIDSVSLLIGYVLLLLKLRIGQILLVIFYFFKIYFYIANMRVESLSDIRFIAEIIFYILSLVILLCSKEVNFYIKTKREKNK